MAAADQKSDAVAARRWKRELDLAERREKDWREEGEKIVKRYRGEERKKSRFNVLWSNTEILRPAIYNSRPNPDVRRRFRDADPVGKAVSTVIERCLSLVVDDYGTDCAVKNDVLDSLLCGRGVSRIRYVASIAQVGGPKAEQAEAERARTVSDTDDGAQPAPEANGDTNEAEEGLQEELDYEQCVIEHVDWHDFRHGYGRVWDEVPWIAFRCKLTKDEAASMLGEDAIAEVEFTAPTSDDPTRPGYAEGETQKLADFWEIWDKEGKRVFFTQADVQRLLYPVANPNGEPPLTLDGFFPIPEPLKMIENTGSLEPIPHFSLYREQADDLDRVSNRITKIVDAIRIRGMYDAKLSEIADLMDSADNALVPVQNARAWSEGGLDKAISWMPVAPAAEVLQSLYQARENAKQIIDEITGISDILRGSTDPGETMGAQQIKANYASVRLQRMQREVQRYVRDLLRLASEVIAEKFGLDTLQKMTELKLPMMADKQQAAMQAQMTGKPPDPTLMQMPTWEDVMGVLRNDSLRGFKVDVETDSTIAGSLDADMAGLSQVLHAVTETMQGLAPLVQAKAMPADAVKEIVMAVVRRARMGLAVEDAFDKLQAPPPPPQPPQDPHIQTAQIKAQSDQQIAQMKVQQEAQLTQIQHQAMAQVEQVKVQAEAQRTQLEMQLKAQLEDQRIQHEAQLEQLRLSAQQQQQQLELETQRMIADANNQTKVLVAQIAADSSAAMQSQKLAHDQAMAQIAASAKPAEPEEGDDDAPTAASYNPVEHDLIPLMAQMTYSLGKPRKVLRDDNGKIIGVE